MVYSLERRCDSDCPRRDRVAAVIAASCRSAEILDCLWGMLGPN